MALPNYGPIDRANTVWRGVDNDLCACWVAEARRGDRVALRIFVNGKEVFHRPYQDLSFAKRALKDVLEDLREKESVT